MQIDDHAPARLALENGKVFHGRAFGAQGTRTGETVFNTAMCGYQEALTDPSYRGQILVMTATQIGNYGVATEDIESAAPQVAGFVVRERSPIASNHRAAGELGRWLAASGVPAIDEIDTRALVRILRTEGALRGAISTDIAVSDAELVRIARESPLMAGRNLAAEASPEARFTWSEDLGAWSQRGRATGERRYRVVALDCGAKRNIYRHFADRGCEVVVLPFDATPEAIRAERPDGLFVSNGPGDPAVVEATIRTLREVAGEVPTFGICLGHQLLALALGATTWKLKFGHRGANQPVRNVLTGRVEITSQNHGFCVDEASLAAAGGEVTHMHLNDGTVAGFRHTEKPIFSVQYHPEASPGPHDSAYLFDCFVVLMDARRPLSNEELSAIQAGAARGMPAIAGR
jgi:carbamoyl-phosphate synthase small subunit